MTVRAYTHGWPSHNRCTCRMIARCPEFIPRTRASSIAGVPQSCDNTRTLNFPGQSRCRRNVNEAVSSSQPDSPCGILRRRKYRAGFQRQFGVTVFKANNYQDPAGPELSHDCAPTGSRFIVDSDIIPPRNSPHHPASGESRPKHCPEPAP